MKKFLFFILFMWCYWGLQAQVPQFFKYQTVVRDNTTGTPLNNKNVSFKISILQGSPTGTSVYTETHNTNTNNFGLVNINIGGGSVVSGNFSTIDWGSSIYFVKIEFDGNGGSNYQLMGTSQILSVPYALYAEKVKNNDDADADPTNEIQTISKTGNLVTLSKGGGSFTDDNTTYTAGTGISIDANNQITNTAPDKVITLTGSGATTVTGSYPNFTISSTDSNTKYTAGTGIIIDASNKIINIAPDQTISFTAGTGINTSGSYPNFTITNSAPDQTVSLTGSGATSVSGTYPNFTISSTDNNTTYSAGNALTLTGTTFDAKNTNALWNANKLQGFDISSSSPSTGNILKWNGSLWSLSSDDNTTYSPGTGLSLSGTTFNASNTTAMWNADKLQGKSIATTAPTSGQVLKWNSGSSLWEPSTDNNNTYTAGSYISINGSNQISNTAPDQTVTLSSGSGISISGTYPNFTISNTGDLSTSNELQTISKSGSTVTLSNGGGSFTDDNTTYTAGSGISINSSNVISNTGDLSTTNELQTISASGSSSPSIDLSNGGGSVYFSAGSGISLSRSSNTISIANSSSCVSGSGTNKYLAVWNGSNSLTTGIIQDAGSYISLGVSPNSDYRILSSGGSSKFGGGFTSSGLDGLYCASTSSSSSYAAIRAIGQNGALAGYFSGDVEFSDKIGINNSIQSAVRVSVWGDPSGSSYGGVGEFAVNTYHYVKLADDNWEGLYGQSNDDDGVAGNTTNGSYRGIYYSGGLGGSGTKSCVERTTKGPVLLYCQESPENWFEDFGEGLIINGQCRISIQSDLLEVVTINNENPIRVFISPNSNIGNWWIEKDSLGFTLFAPDAKNNSKFDWRFVAKRKNYENLRMESFPAAYNDPYLYPENMGAYPKDIFIKLKSINSDFQDYQDYLNYCRSRFAPHETSPYNIYLPDDWELLREKAKQAIETENQNK